MHTMIPRSAGGWAAVNTRSQTMVGTVDLPALTARSPGAHVTLAVLREAGNAVPAEAADVRSSSGPCLIGVESA